MARGDTSPQLTTCVDTTRPVRTTPMTTFHRRPLPDTLIAFASRTGRDMLASAMAAGDALNHERRICPRIDLEARLAVVCV